MEAIATANEALSLFTSIRQLCNSVKTRIDNYRGNRSQFTSLKRALLFAEKRVHVCQGTLEKYRHAIPTDFEFDIIDLHEMMDKLERVAESVKDLEKKLPQNRRGLREFREASSTADHIAQQTDAVREVSSQLNEWNEKLKEVVQQIDIFIPDFSSIPQVRVPVHLDFSTSDTMEGKVKTQLLESVEDTSGNDQTANGHVTAVVGVRGMGGVGKTTALIGLAKETDVRQKFSTGGIYFVAVGKDATPEKLVASLKNIVRESGGKNRSEEIDSTGSLESAVRTTSSWFAGKRALFILDDLWQTSSNETGYFNELIGLLDECPESHMMISTRSNTIASETSAKIEFQPRENTGSEARKMFLSSAKLDETVMHENSCKELVEEILQLCGGVPLLLSIAGAQVRKRTGTAIAALKLLLRSLQRVSLLEKQPKDYPDCFNQAVEASVHTIADALQTAEDYKKHWNEYCRGDASRTVTKAVDFATDCFQRLCILPRSARVSEEFIFGIWNHTSVTIAWIVLESLVDFHLLLEFEDAGGNMKYGLHDVLLDYCVQASQLGQDGNYELYHRQFLCYAWKACHGEESSLSNTASVDTQEDCMVSLDAFWLLATIERSRPWWKVLSSREELSEVGGYLPSKFVPASERIQEIGRSSWGAFTYGVDKATCWTWGYFCTEHRFFFSRKCCPITPC